MDSLSPCIYSKSTREKAIHGADCLAKLVFIKPASVPVPEVKGGAPVFIKPASVPVPEVRVKEHQKLWLKC